MNMATLMTLCSCVVILVIVLYLNFHPKYEQGPLRCLAFLGISVGAITPIIEAWFGSDYEMLPSTAAVSGGVALFMVSHLIAFEKSIHKKQ